MIKRPAWRPGNRPISRDFDPVCSGGPITRLLFWSWLDEMWTTGVGRVSDAGVTVTTGSKCCHCKPGSCAAFVQRSSGRVLSQRRS